MPVLVVYTFFVLFTWTGESLFNLLLRLDREGRLALDRHQIRASNYVGVCVGGTIALIVLSLLASWPSALLAGLIPYMLISPVVATFKCPEGWPRNFMKSYTIAMVVSAGVAASIFTWRSLVDKETLSQNALRPIGSVAAFVFLCGAILAPWVGNIVVTASPKRSFAGFWKSKGGIAILALLLLFIVWPKRSVVNMMRPMAFAMPLFYRR